MGILPKNFFAKVDIFAEKCYTVGMKPYEYIEDFKIKFCDVDFKDEIKPSIALALMEEVACLSAHELGFGYEYLKPRGYAFMVTNLHLEFVRPIALQEVVRVKTWPTPPTHVIFGREYLFETQTGEACIRATSRWCLIDMKAGKLAQSKVIDNQDYSTYNTKKLFDGVKWKQPVFSADEGELRFSMTVANSEYDHNLHVNNTRYADYCMNCFSVAELATRKLKTFSIAYVKQCKEGGFLRFYRKQGEDEAYLVQGVNQAEEIVVQARVAFEG